MTSKTGTTLPKIAGKEEAVADSIFTNPFILPGDDQIFRIREEEKRKKQEAHNQSKTASVWEKNKVTAKSRTGRLKDLLGDNVKIGNVLEATKAPSEEMKAVAPVRRGEKENMTEYIAKKREMFLVQMSLDTKREEIRKLEEKAQLKEEALQRSEQMLEEDAMRFDAFLKENDKKAHDAIKRAEEETKKKQEKSHEIKKLTQQIQALSSEMSKHRESLEDCMKYKKFLDMLTPVEWFEAHRKAHEDKKAALAKERFDAKYKVWDAQRRRIIETHRREMEAKKEAKKGKKKKDDVEDDDADEQRVVIPPAPKLEDEVVDLLEEEPPMYFKEPQQLMDIFSALEEQNLFLIQNSQETERTLEELQHAFKETKQSMESRTGQLSDQINDLQAQISAEEQRSAALKLKRTLGIDVGNGSSNQQEKERLLNELNSKVLNVYEQCGFDVSSKPNTLFMLSQLESKLESLLLDIEKMPQEYVIRAEKEKEKKRRERKREEQQALQIRLQEERNKRAIERSMQAPKKRVGRMVMNRSRPPRKEEIRDNASSGNNDDDEQKYLTM